MKRHMWCFARKSDYGTSADVSFLLPKKSIVRIIRVTKKKKDGILNQVFIDSRKVVPIEFVFAILLQLFVAGPLSLKITFRMVSPREDMPYLVTTAIICSTVVLMCPMMSFIATILYNGITTEFFTQWLQKIVSISRLHFSHSCFLSSPL